MFGVAGHKGIAVKRSPEALSLKILHVLQRSSNRRKHSKGRSLLPGGARLGGLTGSR